MNITVNRFPIPQRRAELASAALVSSTPVELDELVYGKINCGLYQVRVLPEVELYCTRQWLRKSQTRLQSDSGVLSTTLSASKITQRSHIPTQIKDNHNPAMIGTRIFAVMARCRVNTRSNNGAVIMADTIPASKSAAPISPEVLSEYP